MTPTDRALCAATASLLRSAGVLAAFGLLLTGISLAMLALKAAAFSPIALVAGGAVAAIGLAERYFYLRVRVDVGLFSALADAAIGSLADIDDALQQLAMLGLRASRGGVRPLQDRVAGAMRLVRRHRIAVTAQCAMMLLALILIQQRP